MDEHGVMDWSGFTGGAPYPRLNGTPEEKAFQVINNAIYGGGFESTKYISIMRGISNRLKLDLESVAEGIQHL